MKTSNDAKMTVCSIAVTLSILLITLGVYLGTQYLDENYVKYDVEQMLNVCNQIPDPTERKGETITIDKRWIVKSVIANRIYPQLSNQDGIQFFSDYLITSLINLAISVAVILTFPQHSAALSPAFPCINVPRQAESKQPIPVARSPVIIPVRTSPEPPVAIPSLPEQFI